ncbi:hypothetical protein VHEMI00238 [[Torrubiella] hemipterigena]|uniref:Zn(2)-C6 fungal-type domain-containing protein n=1 Tax=[Torrubiella] hemipterigena TaxID=1531966 RepID=A0A0A1T1C3_9HYPO|nr:hypothetical protein VHEMI00238 [[Torrubiella] hemipterigena]
MDALSPSEPARKRLRTSHACDICRSRKIRCDGNTPCSTCRSADQECTYGAEANPRGKSDLVLDGVRRIERILEGLSPFLQNAAAAYIGDKNQYISPPAVNSITSPSTASPSVDASWRQAASQPPVSTDGAKTQDGGGALDNAVLDSMHTSTTEAVLQWPHFDQYPSLRGDYRSIFHLERTRPQLELSPSTIFPYVTQEDITAILDAFQYNVNFWYPTVSQNQLHSVHTSMMSGDPTDNSLDSCLSLLIMALGCASQVTANLPQGSTSTPEEARYRASRRKIGDKYFEAALKKLHIAHLTVNSTSAQCMLFVAFYFAFLGRPLQAWEFISTASTKCLMLLSYAAENAQEEEHERMRRVFWSCYILESDYVAELSACPVSGIARVESSVPLPRTYYSHASTSEDEQSSLYFVACISMRRLLNRVHQLLYAKDTGAAVNSAQFPSIVAELHHQLEDWREVLPPSFAFTVDTSPATNAASGFLRQRYLTCRSVIYRPYLMWLLSGLGHPPDGKVGSPTNPSPEMLKSSRACLDACLMHILNLRGFSHTVLMDTWICSLSMAGAMLVLLAASKIPSLRNLIGLEVFSAGDHLIQLLQQWQELLGGPPSPSVAQSIRIIDAADRFIKDSLSHQSDQPKDPRSWKRIEL